MNLALPREARSLAELVAEDENWDEFLWGLSEDEKLALLHDWEFWARPKQLAPTDEAWQFWFLMTGRGFGKTLTGAQYVRSRCENDPKARIMLVGPTRLDVRETMIEGETGVLSVCPPWFRPHYQSSRLRLEWRRLRLEWRKEGQTMGIAQGYSADKPDRLRGGNWTDIWADEFASFKKPEAWKNIRLALRKGKCRCVVTSTPKVTPEVKALVERADKEPAKVRLTRGSSLENAANLSDEFWDNVADLQGTTFGRQELGGELVQDTDGALFKSASLQDWPTNKPLPKMTMSLVSLDPADSLKSNADEFGIGHGGRSATGDVFIFADHSGQYGPGVWPRKALNLAREADGIVLESNTSENVLIHTLRMALEKDPKGRVVEAMPKIFSVRATQNKAVRAAPAVALVEAGKVWFVSNGNPLAFLQLKEELTTWVPGVSSWSPNRMDWFVWLILRLCPNLAKLNVKTSTTRPKGL